MLLSELSPATPQSGSHFTAPLWCAMTARVYVWVSPFLELALSEKKLYTRTAGTHTLAIQAHTHFTVNTTSLPRKVHFQVEGACVLALLSVPLFTCSAKKACGCASC